MRYERRPDYQRGLRNYGSGPRNGFRPRRVQTAEGEFPWRCREKGVEVGAHETTSEVDVAVATPDFSAPFVLPASSNAFPRERDPSIRNQTI